MSLDPKIANHSAPEKFLKTNENININEKFRPPIDDKRHFSATMSKIDQITKGQKPYVRRILSNFFLKALKTLRIFVIS